MVTKPWSKEDVTEYIQVDATELEIIHPLFHEALGDVKGKSVVDYGCGQGKLLSEMITREAKVYGYDISSSIIEEARGSLGNKAILEVIESGRIPLEDSSVDAVVSNLVLMMCPSVDTLRDVFLEVGRVVKPGGKMAFCVSHPCFAQTQFGPFHNNFFAGYDYFDPGREYQFVFHNKDGTEVTTNNFIDHLYRLDIYLGLLHDSGFTIEKPIEVQIPGETKAAYLFAHGTKKS